MAINIKNPEVSEKASRLARLTRESITEAIGTAIDQRLARIERQQRAERVAAKLKEIGRECAARAPKWWLTYDFDKDLYDEMGLPK